MSDALRIVVVDDHAVVREGIRTILDRHARYRVMGEAGTGAEALALISKVSPDVVILDVALPDMTGLDVVAQLRAAGDATPILMLSVYDNAEYILQAVRTGASGYLLKNSSPAELRDAIEAVHRGDSYYSAAVTNQLTNAVRSGATSEPDRWQFLTPRELDVLRLIAQGLTNRETAKQLGIGQRTVETHRHNLMQKLGLSTTAELVRYCLEHDIPEG